ncbi:hypothetical protein MOSE0_L01178 [Monosporozyma servazzii]
MEARSPRPEHMQLGSGIIIPKIDQPAALLDQLRDSPFRGGPASSTGLLPALPLEQRSMDHEMMVNGCNCNGTTGETHPRGFPSPPQSPRPNKFESEKKDDDDADKYKNILLTQPVWNESLTTSKYELFTKGFISKYRIFKDKDSYPMSKTTKEINNKHLLRNSRSEIDSAHYYSPILSRNGHITTSRNITTTTTTTTTTHKRKPRTSSTHRPAVHSPHHTTPNVKWELLPDFSPNCDTLPIINTNKSLKVEWKGSTMDLSQDPLRNKLHPAELNLAQILRLPCDLYLDSKRRLFMAKVDRLKQGLPFRRTDAQKACHIDVNKASKLYTAFEKVGWLDDSLFTQHL